MIELVTVPLVIVVFVVVLVSTVELVITPPVTDDVVIVLELTTPPVITDPAVTVELFEIVLLVTELSETVELEIVLPVIVAKVAVALRSVDVVIVLVAINEFVDVESVRVELRIPSAVEEARVGKNDVYEVPLTVEFVIVVFPSVIMKGPRWVVKDIFPTASTALMWK